MNLNRYCIRIFIVALSLLSFIHCRAKAQHGIVQDDPVLAPNAVVVPTIDGIGDDACWQNVPWQSIAQVWIPYDSTVTPDDYSGRYKVIWSSETNLLYFLIEVHNDVFVDGFNPNGSTSAIYNYDIAEVFIDEKQIRWLACA
ncbi:MAG: sugar-binding protein [Bacteroidota bacterium]|jgi:hypothetical protein